MTDNELSCTASPDTVVSRRQYSLKRYPGVSNKWCTAHLCCVMHGTTCKTHIASAISELYSILMHYTLTLSGLALAKNQHLIIPSNKLTI